MPKRRLAFSVAAILLAGCVGAPGPITPSIVRVLPSGPPSHEQRMDIGLVVKTTEQDLLWSARQLYGDTIVRRALSAQSYIVAKHYQGMLPPPPPDAGPDWKYPEPPTALLFEESGTWVVATREGVRQARPDKITEIRKILSKRGFWAEPAWAPPGCTDAGASLLLAKAPGQKEVVRSATCGATGLSELLVFRSLES